ncbi:hypothetical protein LSTR_LSTR008331 [Laodelphax striatellus]|uniref:Uncharacterized protein n=1 Tax=Laodelphax striatellus TaxID=195883 RepID=A0A482XJV2_LAOST|nr:hypothetical protein LSTR_LSTR008331 [Laodelphax striatellus]
MIDRAESPAKDEGCPGFQLANVDRGTSDLQHQTTAPGAPNNNKTTSNKRLKTTSIAQPPSEAPVIYVGEPISGQETALENRLKTSENQQLSKVPTIDSQEQSGIPTIDLKVSTINQDNYENKSKILINQLLSKASTIDPQELSKTSTIDFKDSSIIQAESNYNEKNSKISIDQQVLQASTVNLQELSKKPTIGFKEPIISQDESIDDKKKPKIPMDQKLLENTSTDVEKPVTEQVALNSDELKLKTTVLDRQLSNCSTVDLEESFIGEDKLKEIDHEKILKVLKDHQQPSKCPIIVTENPVTYEDELNNYIKILKKSLDQQQPSTIDGGVLTDQDSFDSKEKRPNASINHLLSRIPANIDQESITCRSDLKNDEKGFEVSIGKELTNSLNNDREDIVKDGLKNDEKRLKTSIIDQTSLKSPSLLSDLEPTTDELGNDGKKLNISTDKEPSKPSDIERDFPNLASWIRPNIDLENLKSDQDASSPTEKMLRTTSIDRQLTKSSSIDEDNSITDQYSKLNISSHEEPSKSSDIERNFPNLATCIPSNIDLENAQDASSPTEKIVRTTSIDLQLSKSPSIDSDKSMTDQYSFDFKEKITKTYITQQQQSKPSNSDSEKPITFRNESKNHESGLKLLSIYSSPTERGFRNLKATIDTSKLSTIDVQEPIPSGELKNDEKRLKDQQPYKSTNIASEDGLKFVFKYNERMMLNEEQSKTSTIGLNEHISGEKELESDERQKTLIDQQPMNSSPNERNFRRGAYKSYEKSLETSSNQQLSNSPTMDVEKRISGQELFDSSRKKFKISRDQRPSKSPASERKFLHSNVTTELISHEESKVGKLSIAPDGEQQRFGSLTNSIHSETLSQKLTKMIDRNQCTILGLYAVAICIPIIVVIVSY